VLALTLRFGLIGCSCSHLEGFRRVLVLWLLTKEFEAPFERTLKSPAPFEKTLKVPDFYLENLEELRRSRTPKVKEAERLTFKFFFLNTKRGFGTPKIPKTKMVFGSSGFQHDFWLSGCLLDGILKGFSFPVSVWTEFRRLLAFRI
ncbi:hypothetical protein RhiirA1_477932, partial [Rhizophagus irregularis]